MGMFSDLLSATVKTVLTPVAIVRDAGELVVTGEVGESTKELLQSASEDLGEAAEDLADGDLI